MVRSSAGSTQAVVRQKVNSGAISHNLKSLLTSTIYTFLEPYISKCTSELLINHFIFIIYVCLSILKTQVHGIVRRSSSFNTGRIEHLYKNPQAHIEGSK